MILAVDPGTTKSGFVILDEGHVTSSGVLSNREASRWSRVTPAPWRSRWLPRTAWQSEKMFETVRWIGRFQQASRDPEAVRLVSRRDVKLHLCGSAKAKDANVRQALLDLFPGSGGGKTPQIGTEAARGPLRRFVACVVGARCGNDRAVATCGDRVARRRADSAAQAEDQSEACRVVRLRPIDCCDVSRQWERNFCDHGAGGFAG